MPATLLGPDDPPPFETLNEGSTSRVLVVCDHASCRVPAALDNLGLSEIERTEHIGWDIGAGAVARRLSALLDAPAILAGYSRLVIDCNRRPGHPESILAESDGIPVPGNQGLTPEEAERRAQALFHPYHEAIAGVLDSVRSRGETPAYVALHTFTPNMNGMARPWHFGVLWDRDARIARPLIEALRKRTGLRIGDNEPYSGRDHGAFSNGHHATPAGLPNAMIEIRGDLLADDAGIARCEGMLAEVLEEVLAPGPREEER